MCSRYELDGFHQQVAARFDLSRTAEFAPRPEIRPTDPAPVILAGGEARLMSWGLTASWSKKPLINARAESLAQRKSFKPLLENRCAVPASAYFEWRQAGGRRRKMRIARPDGALFAFAGLVEEERFTIITCSPSPSIAAIHDRMPVILVAGSEAMWLDGGKDFAAVAHLLAPYPDADLAPTDAAPPEPQGDLFGAS